MMNYFFRQGDVLLSPIDPHSDTATVVTSGQLLPHLTLAKGEVTGHCHQISQGEAKLYERNGVLYLQVFSPTAMLTHEEHEAIKIPQGQWQVLMQREYEPVSGYWLDVAD